MNYLLITLISLHFVVIIVCATTESFQSTVQNGDQDEQKTTAFYQEPPTTVETKLPNDKDIVNLKDSVKALNDQLQAFNSLYIGRLDQKMTTIVSNVASIDSNVKNVQERAHVWDTFQLHVSAWNDLMKSLDRKIDIINSGQEKVALLEGKLSMLLNLEYNSARILNKLSSVEDRLDQIERSLRRQQSDISSLNQKDATSDPQSNRHMPNIIKGLDNKADKIISMVQRHTPLGRRFARRFGNDTYTPQKIIIKCSTPPTIEETVKDVASKVDLIYDKIISDNISSDDCDKDDDTKNIDSTEVIEEEIEQDYPLLVFNSDEDESQEKQFKRHTRHIRNRSAPITRKKRYDSNYADTCTNGIDEIKTVIKELLQRITSSDRELYTSLQDISTNIEYLKDSPELSTNNDVNNSQQSVDQQIIKLDNLFNNICKQVKDKYTSGIQSEIKRYCHVFLSPNKNERVGAIASCLNENGFMPIPEESIVKTFFSGKNETTLLPSDFIAVCKKYISKFVHVQVKDIESPKELTCFIVYKYLKNQTVEYCTNPKLRFCDSQSFFVFQRRTDTTVKFSRSWQDYKWGFGDFESGNYWIGNEALHVLTRSSHPAILKIIIHDFDGKMAWAEYDRFRISSEANAYRIQLSGYRGNASDSLSYHNGAAFSTVDVRHDEAPACCPCANSYGRGGWWYKSCFESNLNAIYFDPPRTPLDGGITWELWRPHITLAKTTMALGFLKPSVTHVTTAEDP